jgi:beta-glucanase (GH16 family)
MKVVLLFTVSVLLFAQKPAGVPGWVLTFADEFEGRDLDLTKWSPRDPLRKTDAMAEATVSGGQLHLASGAISTFGLFSQKLGRFEIRFRATAGRGVTSGFHLLPLPLGPLPAIDVFEAEGDAPTRVMLANRWGTEQTERSYGDSFDVSDLSAGFHTIAVEWDRDRIVWFVDGKEKFRSVDGVPLQPMFPMIAGTFDVDYIRLYRRP